MPDEAGPSKRTPRLRRPSPEPASPIARERQVGAPPSTTFLALTAGLAVGSFALAFALGVVPVDRAAGETPTLFPVGVRSARAISGLFSALLVGSTAIVGRRLLHSEPIGLVAAALVALDPLAIASSRLAIPDPVAAGSAMLAVALFLSPRHNAHWAGSAAFFLAAFAEPRLLLWCAVLGILVLMRGHIYAAPRHLGWTLLQVAGLPAIGALLGILWLDGDRATCLHPGLWDTLSLRTIAAPGPGLLLVPGPVTWFAGMAALVALAGTALVAVLMNFRIARLPGRIQLRLVEDLPSGRARIFWVAGLAVLAPIPLLWVPLFALALAAGIRELAADAPGFGIVLGAVAVGVAFVVLVKLWPFIQGSGDLAELGDLKGLLPWTRVEAC